MGLEPTSSVKVLFNHLSWCHWSIIDVFVDWHSSQLGHLKVLHHFSTTRPPTNVVTLKNICSFIHLGTSTQRTIATNVCVCGLSWKTSVTPRNHDSLKIFFNCCMRLMSNTPVSRIIHTSFPRQHPTAEPKDHYLQICGKFLKHTSQGKDIKHIKYTLKHCEVCHYKGENWTCSRIGCLDKKGLATLKCYTYTQHTFESLMRQQQKHFINLVHKGERRKSLLSLLCWYLPKRHVKSLRENPWSDDNWI